MAIPASFQGRARRDAAAFYLNELARGVLAGEVEIATGEARLALATGEFLLLGIDVKPRTRSNRIVVTLRWPARPRAGRPAFTRASSSVNADAGE
jgi:hypothetical protein